MTERSPGPEPGAACLCIHPLGDVPEIREGDDVARVLAEALDHAGLRLQDGDVLVVSSKVVSKALGLRVPAQRRAASVIEESDRVVAERATATGVTRIVHTLAGPTLAGAGIDSSNVGPDGEHTVLLLPRDPDVQARRLLDGVAAHHRTGARFGVILSDTSGRPWRAGQVDYALGAAGLTVVDDLRGRVDADGRPLGVTVRAVADELASAADLVKGKSRGVAAVVVRGAAITFTEADEGTRPLTRPRSDDWFSLGRREAVLSALGIAPASPVSEDVGLPSVGVPDDDPRDLAERIDRACRAATHPRAYPALPSEHPRTHQQRSDPLEGVRTHVVQIGVRIEAPDEFTLGLVTARLVAALAAEGVDSTPARPGHGAPPARLGLPQPAGAIGAVLFV